MVYWKAQGVPVRIIRNLLWGKNPVAEQNLLTEEEQETETVVTAEEDVTEQPEPAQLEPVEETKEPVQPKTVEVSAEPTQPEPETVDESAKTVKKPSRKKSNTRKKSAAKTDDKTEEKKSAEKKPAEKKPAEKKPTGESDELTLAVEKVLTDQSIVPQVVKFIRQYKTKQGINNALNKEFKDSKRTSEIYSAIKPLIADKKGK